MHGLVFFSIPMRTETYKSSKAKLVLPFAFGGGGCLVWKFEHQVSSIFFYCLMWTAGEKRIR